MEYVGSCGLCQETKNLQRSHLYPAAAYKQLRDPTSSIGPNPVFITSEKASTTSKQVTSYFLCKECEQRFSTHGESYVSTQWLLSDGQFRLRALLEASTPISSGSSLTSGSVVRVYDAQPLLGSHIAQYSYYAASIFWRASAHNWEWEGKPIASISLGRYQEDFRRYLLGEAPFPQNARLWVRVASERQDPAVQIVVGPTTVRMGKSHRHKFWIGGIGFVLFLGSDAPKQFDLGALNGNGRQLVWLGPLKDDSLLPGMLKLIAGAKRSGKLRSKAGGSKIPPSQLLKL